MLLTQKLLIYISILTEQTWLESVYELLRKTKLKLVGESWLVHGIKSSNIHDLYVSVWPVLPWQLSCRRTVWAVYHGSVRRNEDSAVGYIFHASPSSAPLLYMAALSCPVYHCGLDVRQLCTRGRRSRQTTSSCLAGRGILRAADPEQPSPFSSMVKSCLK